MIMPSRIIISNPLPCPNTITEIGDNAFYNCTSLNTITFPNGLEVIGDNAFYACGQLTNVVIPNSVTSIGKTRLKTTIY